MDVTSTPKKKKKERKKEKKKPNKGYWRGPCTQISLDIAKTAMGMVESAHCLAFCNCSSFYIPRTPTYYVVPRFHDPVGARDLSHRSFLAWPY
jgi:hypothetical protein